MFGDLTAGPELTVTRSSSLATNAAMRKLAESCGFVLEGIQREQAYDGDGFSDIVLYGLLSQEWSR